MTPVDHPAEPPNVDRRHPDRKHADDPHPGEPQGERASSGLSHPGEPNGRADPDGPTQDGADAIDRIVLHEAAALLTGRHGQIVVIDDENAALVAGLSPEAGAVRVHCDSWTAEQRVAAVGRPETTLHADLDADLLTGATLVLLRLPKNLAALDEIGRAVARHAHPDVVVIAGGRAKHMSRGMNATLAKSFADVAASLGRQKCRALLAQAPTPVGPATPPAQKTHGDLDLVVCAYGAAFAGSSVDLGTRFLLSFLDQTVTQVHDAVDLGCGTGVLATALARRHPGARVLGVDDSAAACRSTLATAEANGVSDRVRVHRGDALLGQEDESADLIVCNPPFHRGTTRDSSVAFTMFADSERILRPRGQLWTVFNTHLPYRQALRQSVGPTKIMGQNADYVVTRSVRSD